MILTDHTITAEINNGNIVVEPFIPDNLGTNSIDLTLSNTLILYTDSVLDVRKKNLDTGSKEVEGFGGKLEKFGKVAAAAFAAAA